MIAAAAIACAAAVVVGGTLDAEDGAPAAAPPTFSNEVVRIFQRSCQGCHHDGDIAPFPLMTYADAAPIAGLIRGATASRAMPPWGTRSGCPEYADDPRLSDEEIDTIARWADAGAPEGDPAVLPAPLEFPAGWKLGEPDVVLANAPGGFTVPADGRDEVFQCFSVPTDFRTDRYVSAIEVRPGTRATVHHVLIFLDARGAAAELDRDERGPGYECFGAEGLGVPVIWGWNPGADPVRFPDGTAVRIPAGSRLVVQIHYSDGFAGQVDRTLIGLHFARSQVHRRVATIVPQNNHFTIPAGEPDSVVTASTVLRRATRFSSVRPHMHLLGTRIVVEAILPGGESRCLIDLDWDIHWQRSYSFKDPVELPAGTKIVVTGHYDNTAANPRNPNSPPADVARGRKSYDEMLFASLTYSRDAGRLAAPAPSLESVRVEGDRLVVAGAGFRRGASIEVDGRLLADTRTSGRGRRVSSSVSWRDRVQPGVPVSVAVVNSDGGRTAETVFVLE